MKNAFFMLLLLLCAKAKAADYYVSANGNDINSGLSPASSWRSLEKVNSAPLRPGDRVLFRRGDTFYGRLNIKHGGNASASIYFGAYGSGNKPVITGFRRVDSWIYKGGNIWESRDRVSHLDKIQILTVNGKNTPMGRYPNSDFLTYDSKVNDVSLTSKQLNGSKNWTGADVVYYSTPYRIGRQKIKRHSGQVLYLEAPKSSNLHAKISYYFAIQNDIRTLDTLNEWYYNSANGKLSIYSNSKPGNVQVANIDTLFTIAHFKGYISINDLAFSGANIHAVGIGVNTNISIQNCEFSLCGYSAVYAGNWGDFVNDLTVQNCTITNMNNCGIRAHKWYRSTKINNNRITNIGMDMTMLQSAGDGGHGILVAGDNSSVENNRIDSTGSVGIDFRFGNNILIKNNFITNYCKAQHLKDGGAIYTWNWVKQGYNPAKGLKIIDNIVMNGGAFSPGIYLDDGSNGVEVRGNVSMNGRRGIYVHNGWNNEIKNNLTFNNSEAELMINNDNPAVRSKDITVMGNDFISASSAQWVVWIRNIDKMAMPAKFISDHNVYASPVVTDSKNNLIEIYLNGKFHNVPLTEFKTLNGTDKSSSLSPKKVNSTRELRIEYNSDSKPKSIVLDKKYIDVRGRKYDGKLTLEPFSAVVLIENGELDKLLPPIINGGDRKVYLEDGIVKLKGMCKNAGFTSLKYNWTCISGDKNVKIVNASGLEADIDNLAKGEYIFELSITDERGTVASSSVKVIVETKPIPISLLPAAKLESNEQGVSYKYFEGTNFEIMPDFSALTPTKKGNTNGYDISIAERAEKFAFEFTSLIKIPADGIYSFFINSDDGSKLYIDDKLIVDNDGLHGPRELSGSIGLKKGNHIIRVEYFQQTGGKKLMVSFSGNGFPKQPIPGSMLFTISKTPLKPAVEAGKVTNGLKYRYYEGSYEVMPDFKKLAVVAEGHTDRFDLSKAILKENYLLQFEGYINIPSDGQYTFYTGSDDGSMLYIDDELVVDNNGLHGPREVAGSAGLKKGFHNIRVEYFQQSGGKLLTVSYEGNGIQKKQVPAMSLFTLPEVKFLPALAVGGVSKGLKYKYYEGRYSSMPDFKNLSPIEEGFTDHIDLLKAKSKENYLLTFEGYLNISSDNEYTFYTTSDDGSKLYVDDQLVVNNDGLHGAREVSGSIGLQKGYHSIRVEYFQATGGRTLHTHYSAANMQKTEIPSSIFYVKNEYKQGLNYKYYEQGGISSLPNFRSLTPKKTGIATDINLSPAARATYFLFEFDGYIKVPVNGEYTFYLTSDDGSRLYLNEILSIDNDGAHSAVTKKKSSYLSKGYHAIKLEYFQQSGGKVLLLEMEGPGLKRQTVPADMFYRGVAADLHRPSASDLINGIGYKYFESASFNMVPDFSTWKPVKEGIIPGIDISSARKSEVFGFEFSGYLQIKQDGYYSFYTSSDDGSLLYIDGEKVVDNDGLHGMREMKGKVYLEKGYHSILVGYFQETGYRKLTVSYEGPGISKRVIPADVLFVRANLAAEFKKIASSGPLASSQALKNENQAGGNDVVNAYPNPFMNFVKVSLMQRAGQYEVAIFDVSGRLLQTKKGSKNQGLYIETINTTSLPNGLYFIRINSGGETKTIKVQKR